MTRHMNRHTLLAWAAIATVLAGTAAAQAPQNPQSPAGKPSPTAPNAQGMMTDPGPARPAQPPSGVPNSSNVNPGEAPKPPAAASQPGKTPAT